MQAAEQIGIETLRTTMRGLVNKGPLVSFMLAVIFTMGFLIVFEHKTYRSDLREQKIELDSLKSQVLACEKERIMQASRIDIQDHRILMLQDQVSALINPNPRRRK